MGTVFTPAPQPFARWVGPYSPARGRKSGFRFHKGRLGVWVPVDSLETFWTAESSPGARGLQQLVKDVWGQGRVLLLPDGKVIKPDPEGDGTRYLIGRLRGAVVLERPNGTLFDLADARSLDGGAPWPGPSTTGIECKIDGKGRILCDWELPTERGKLCPTVQITGPDPDLAAGLRHARPGKSGARVRVQIGGAVITNGDENDDFGVVWRPRYVGRIDLRSWPRAADWIVH